jgi:hypothetical protein
MVGRLQRVHASQVQGFIGINIPQPGQEGLVEQQRLELAVMGMKPFVQFGGGKARVERLGSQIAQH